jgi:hypothetical protein
MSDPEGYKKRCALKARIVDALKLIDGFSTLDLVQLCVCTVSEAEVALNELRGAGTVVEEYEPRRGYSWRLIREV